MNLLSPQLMAFIAVSKHKTVHAAADTLHITQTAVTQRILSLENKLGVSLFVRSRRGMQLTAEGESLLHYCQAARDLEGATLAQIRGIGISEEVELGITGPSSIMRSRIIPQCIQVMKQFPRLLLQFNINDIENRHHGLRLGQFDFAVINKEDVAREMLSKKLHPEEYVLVCCAAWHKRSLKDIIKNETIIDFDPSDSMTFNYLKKYKLFDLAKTKRYYVNRTESLAMMLCNGLGYGLLTLEFSKPYVTAKQLIILNDAKVYEHDSLLAWYPRTEPPAYFSAIINAID